MFYLFYSKSPYIQFFCYLTLFICFIYLAPKKFLNARTIGEYRNSEIFLLPMSEGELVKYCILKFLILNLPMAIPLAYSFYGIILYKTNDMSLLFFFSMAIQWFFLLAAMSVHKELSLHFKKVHPLYKFLSFQRSSFLFFIVFGTFGLAYFFEKSSGYNFSRYTFLLTSIIFICYLVKGSQLYLNEHVIFEKKKFKILLDVPSFLFIASLVFIIL